MKKLLALLLAMILCLGVLVACDTPEESSSSSSSEESSTSTEGPVLEDPSTPRLTSKTFEGQWDYENATKEVVNGITADTFSAYRAILSEWKGTHVLHEKMLSGKKFFAKMFSNYEEFSETVSEFDAVVEATFENNYVLVVEGVSGYIRDKNAMDIYYTDLKKENGSYTLTYNLIERGQEEALDFYTDIVIIPKSLFEDDISDIDLTVIKKQYVFKGDTYNSECELTTYYPTTS